MEPQHDPIHPPERGRAGGLMPAPLVLTDEQRDRINAFLHEVLDAPEASAD